MPTISSSSRRRGFIGFNVVKFKMDSRFRGSDKVLVVYKIDLFLVGAYNILPLVFGQDKLSEGTAFVACFNVTF